MSSTWSPEANWSVRVYPNRVQQLSWTNPFTNRLLFEGGINISSQHYDYPTHKFEESFNDIPNISEADVANCCVGKDEVAEQVHTGVGSFHPGAFGNGGCFFSGTLCSGAIGQSNLDRIGNARPRLSASYITGSHNAKVGWEAQIFWQKQWVEVTAPQLLYNMTSPVASCINAADPAASTCGTPHPMFAQTDPYNLDRRPRPVSFIQNAGSRNFDDRLTTHALYVQDQWTVNRFTINGALRYDNASSKYNPTCLNANVFVTTGWCTQANDGVSFHDITPRWGVAWDVMGDGKTAVKWNMGKYLSAARFAGVYSDSNLGRNSLNSLFRTWTDNDGDRLIDCNLSNSASQSPTNANPANVSVDTCGSANAANLARFGASPEVAFGGTFFCGQERVKGVIENTEWGSDYCNLAGQDLYSGWGARRSEWQLGLGIQREIIPRLSAEVTYNQRWYQNLQITDTLGQGCDLYTANREQCLANMNNFLAPQMLDNDDQMRAQWSFYRVTAPVDDRLPNGGGYAITGLNTRGTFSPLPGGQNVATYQTYTSGWKGIDTNFVLRARTPPERRHEHRRLLHRRLRDHAERA